MAVFKSVLLHELIDATEVLDRLRTQLVLMEKLFEFRVVSWPLNLAAHVREFEIIDSFDQ